MAVRHLGFAGAENTYTGGHRRKIHQHGTGGCTGGSKDNVREKFKLGLPELGDSGNAGISGAVDFKSPAELHGLAVCDLCCRGIFASAAVHCKLCATAPDFAKRKTCRRKLLRRFAKNLRKI